MLVFFLASGAWAQAPDWTFLKGYGDLPYYPSYGTQGVAAPGNTPGARRNAVRWESEGKLYLFGGDGQYSSGTSLFNDLWEYDLATGNWRWLKGNNTANQPGVYGNQGLAAAANTPGARQGSITWLHGTKLYLFGGYGYRDSELGKLNDLWEYDLGTGNWRWLGGSNIVDHPGIYGTQGLAANSNIPGGRYNSVGWQSENKLYLFGGSGYGGNLNDLWEYDLATGNWRWLKGNNTSGRAGIYGEQGVAAVGNTPGARFYATNWQHEGKLYLFGGFGFDRSGLGSGVLDDLWEYDPATGNWRWLKGSSIYNQAARYGTLGVAAVDNTPGARSTMANWQIGDKLYLFGGANNGGRLNDLWEFDLTSGNWRWLKGSNKIDEAGTYGTQGLAAAGNSPGGRQLAMSWLSGGKFYLFGGVGNAASGTGKLDDLWEYDLITGNWRWLQGSNTVNQTGVYGTQEVAHQDNIPGARTGSGSWQSGEKLYLFGGNGNVGFVSGDLNDLWEYDPVTNNWRWIKGSNKVNKAGIYGSQGEAAATIAPGARRNPVTWQSGGKLYLFGGDGYGTSLSGLLNDLWEYDPVTGNWRWLKGSKTINQPGIYGTQGLAEEANVPGARQTAVSWQSGGKLYLFGGNGLAASGTGRLNDLWEYDLTTGNWRWLTGSNTVNQAGVYGTQGLAAAGNTPGGRNDAVGWESGGKFYLFGGFGSGASGTGSLNDLWEYNPATNNWRWLKGSTAVDQAGNYGTLGIASPSNVPKGRQSAVGWQHRGKLYLFGGAGKATFGISPMNDLWEYDLVTNNWRWLKGSRNAYQAGTYGMQGVADAANTPGARFSSMSWERRGWLFLFGGLGQGVNEDYNIRGDLWVTQVSLPNAPPTGISLSASSLNENAGPNAMVGSFNTTDADPGDSHTYTLVAGTGDEDNASFSITGNSLIMNFPPDYELKSVYSIRIRTDDGRAFLPFEKVFPITINDLDEIPPTVTISSDLTRPTNQNPVTVKFDFSESVAGFDADDVLVSGGTKDTFSGSGKYYTLAIIPQAGIITVEVGGNLAKDAAGNGNTAAPPFTIAFDGMAPEVVSLVQEDLAGEISNAASIKYRLTFSEAVTGVDVDDFNLSTTGSAEGAVAAVSALSALAYEVMVSALSGEGTLRLDLNNGGTGIADAAGNTLSGGYTSGQHIALDRVAPAAPAAPDLADASDRGASPTDNITADDTPTLTGTAEAGTRVILFDAGVQVDTTVAHPATGAWSVTVPALPDGSHSFTITATDVAGNTSPTSEALALTIDTQPPVVASLSLPTDKTYLAGEALTFTLHFSKTLFIAGAGPFLPLAIGHQEKEAAYSSGSGTTDLLFTYEVLPGDLDTDGIGLGTSLAANGASLQDLAGNPAKFTLNGLGTTAGLLVDAVAPTLTEVRIVSNQADGTKAKAGDVVTLSFTASEAIKAPTVTIAGQAATIVPLSATRYSASYTMGKEDAEGAVAFTIRFSDLVDNPGKDVAATTDNSMVLFDRTAPAVAMDIQAGDPVNAPFTASITFSEAVTGFSAAGISVANGRVSDFTARSATQYTATINPIDQGLVTLQVGPDRATDLAGNGNEASAVLSRRFDSIAPTGYTIAFSEAEVNRSNQQAVSLQVSGAEAGALYFYSISSSSAADTPLTGTAIAPAAGFDITNIQVSSLADGLLTVSFYQQDAAGNTGATVTAMVYKKKDLTTFTSLPGMAVPIRTAFAALSLPATMEVVYSDNTRQQLEVNWTASHYNGLVAGVYELMGTFILPPNATNLANFQPLVTVTVQPNKSPTDILLSNTSFNPAIAAKDEPGKQPEAVGRFSTEDADDPLDQEPANQHVYTLVSGPGEEDNPLFEIIGRDLLLKSNKGLSGRKQFSIRIRTTDPYQNTLEKAFILHKGSYDKAVAELKIVNTFSPDGDGINDTWTIPELRFYNQVEIEVFDRSGIRLFHTTDPEKGWDGKDLRGQTLQGPFLYVVKVRDINLVKKGVVTIL